MSNASLKRFEEMANTPKVDNQGRKMHLVTKFVWHKYKLVAVEDMQLILNIPEPALQSKNALERWFYEENQDLIIDHMFKAKKKYGGVLVYVTYPIGRMDTPYLEWFEELMAMSIAPKERLETLEQMMAPFFEDLVKLKPRMFAS